MRQNTFHLSVQKKTNYFSYFFHRKMLGEYSFSPMTTLYFEDKTGDVNSHPASINNTNVVEHTYHQHNYHTNNHSPSLVERKEKNDFDKIDSTESNNYLFHNKIANRFTHFTFMKDVDASHTKHAITFANTSKNFSSSKDASFHHQVKQETYQQQNIHVTELIHQKEKTYVERKQIEQMEQRVVSKVEQKLKEKLRIVKSTHHTHEEHIRIQREEKKDADKIYTLVMQRWDKEQKRKGYLYA